MIVQSMVIYYGTAQAFGISIDRTIAAIFIVSINTGAYAGEIVRGGIFAVDKGRIRDRNSTRYDLTAKPCARLYCLRSSAIFCLQLVTNLSSISGYIRVERYLGSWAISLEIPLLPNLPILPNLYHHRCNLLCPDIQRYTHPALCWKTLRHRQLRQVLIKCRQEEIVKPETILEIKNLKSHTVKTKSSRTSPHRS